MRKSSRFAALALTAALALGVATPVFAAAPTAWVADSSLQPVITKHVEGNQTIITTDQTYTFNFAQKDYKTSDGGTSATADVAAISPISVTLAASSVTEGTTDVPTAGSGSGSLIEAIKAAQFPHAGIYAYTVTETGFGDATTKDESTSYTMYVTVENKDAEDADTDGSTLKIAKVQFVAGADSAAEGDKVDAEFTNKYESFADLEVTKTVEGASADKTKDFTFTVVVTLPANATLESSYTGTYSGQHSHSSASGTIDSTAKTVTFSGVTLAHDEKFTARHLPSGATYTVTETVADGYTTTKTGDTGTVPKTGTATAAFTNTKTNITPTGLILDNAPFLILGATAVAGIVLYGAAKRKLTA